MNKIIFCNVVWSWFYRGYEYNADLKDTAEEDELTIFLTHNHFCYGYVNDEAEVDNISEFVGDEDVIHDVTVIWTAIDPETDKCKIIGWYEHADVYGKRQRFYDVMLYDKDFKQDGNWDYYIKTHETNAYYVKRRTFAVTDDTSDTEVLQYIKRNRDKYLLGLTSVEEQGHYKLISSRKNKSSIDFKFLHGAHLQKFFKYNEALELYKQFKFDYEQLDDEEKTDELNKYHLECLYNMAAISMTLHDYFSACSLYQKYLEQSEDNELKSKVLRRMMDMFNEEKDWQHLREVVVEYRKLNSFISDETVTGYIDKLKEMQRDAMFPSNFTFKGIEFTRIDDDDVFDNYCNNDSGSEIAIVTKWPDELMKFYERITKASLPEGVTRFPFDCDVAIVDALLSDKIITHSIFTEYIHIYNLDDFHERDDETDSFKIDSADVEIYFVDYSKMNDDVVKHNGVIKYTDGDIDKLKG